ncbi:hypothetical protein [Microbacterium sp.]|uniref:hypothetical protein n=1 Tax=Microbacterium sp. TaxID=51671 RepID=UPI0025E0BBDB|nr:hypothetical protein [Microbacterium sp.]MBT9605962.1 hypothetical protein [Microbacterium sp.]
MAERRAAAHGLEKAFLEKGHQHSGEAVGAFLAEDETAADIVFGGDPDPRVAPSRFDADGEVSRGDVIEGQPVRAVTSLDGRDGPRVASMGGAIGFEVVM